MTDYGINSCVDLSCIWLKCGEMALTLRSTTSVQRSDKISAVLDKIITPGTDAAERRFREAKEAQRSEFETYMEKETWSRMKTDREKDMVLMFGDDDVRVFKRNPSRNSKPRKSAVGGSVLSKADLADVSGLVPVPLDKKVMRVVTSGDYVPFSQEERQRIQARKQELALRRQQLANQYVFVSHAAHAQSLPSARAQQLAELGIQVPKDTTKGEEPSAIPLKAWQTWIPRRTDNSKDGEEGNAHDLRNKRRQRRHHRLNCKYHPFSTNSEMRRLAIGSSFPRGALHTSIDRVQHAANGAPNGEGVRFQVESCFAPVEGVGGPNPIDDTTAYGFGAGAARALRRGTTPLNLTDAVKEGDLSEFVPSAMDVDVSSIPGAFMTEANTTRGSAATRCCIPSLAPFEQPPRPHTAEGTFVDCNCTPRLTDDELDMFGLRDHNQTPSPASASGGTSKPAKRTLLGSATRAEKRLDLWHRDFAMVNVHSGSRLQSLLEEREDNRSFVTNEREHLNLIVREAELSGADFRVSRRHRCTTPMRSSMWAPVFESIGDDSRHIVGNATAFASLLDYCEELDFPSTDWEHQMLDDIRRACVDNASQRQSRPATVSPASHKKGRADSITSGGDRRSSQQSVKTSTERLPVSSPQSIQHDKSVFVVATKKGNQVQGRQRLGSSSSSRSDIALNETFALQVLEVYGGRLFPTKRGVDIANHFRELCGLSNKAFLTLLFSKESVWEMCPDAHQLQKRLVAK